MKRKICCIDTEFRDSNEKYVHPVCCVLNFPSVDKSEANTETFWTNEGQDVTRLVERFKSLKNDHLFISYFASAEARFLLSVGLDVNFILNEMKWVDPYVLWRMMQHTDSHYQYGWMKIKQNGCKVYCPMVTTEPENPELYDGNTIELEDGTLKTVSAPQHKRVGMGLHDVVGRLFEKDIDREHKDKMRDVVLYGHVDGEYTEQQKNDILFYCADDTKYLYSVMCELFSIFKTRYNYPISMEKIYGLSRWMVAMGVVESNGIPINRKRLETFSDNYLGMDDGLTEAINKQYPFYKKEKTSAQDKRNGKGDFKWVFKMDNFTKFIDSLGIDFPRTEKGNYTTKKDVLRRFETIDELKTLWYVREAKKHIAFFRPDNLNERRQHNILSNIGSDDRIRVIQGAYGSSTGRNQPSVKRGWILGMVTWMRTLIEAPSGYSVVGCDYSSQEYFLQAVLGNDNQMLRAYWSSDPYLWFAKKCGMMHENVQRKHGKYYVNDEECSPELQLQYTVVRNVFKQATLGIGYGLGYEKLAQSLMASAYSSLPAEKKELIGSYRTKKKNVKEAEALLYSIKYYHKGAREPYMQPKHKYSNFYKDEFNSTFRDYVKWRQSVYQNYKFNGKIVLPDGWALLFGKGKDENKNSIQNFPVQGTASCILREATCNMLSEGMEVLFTLHDAIYCLCKKGDEQHTLDRMTEIMKNSTSKIVGKSSIRVDGSTYETNWEKLESDWTKDKGGAELKEFGEYFIRRVE